MQAVCLLIFGKGQHVPILLSWRTLLGEGKETHYRIPMPADRFKSCWHSTLLMTSQSAQVSCFVIPCFSIFSDLSGLLLYSSSADFKMLQKSLGKTWLLRAPRHLWNTSQYHPVECGGGLSQGVPHSQSTVLTYYVLQVAVMINRTAPWMRQ